MDSENENLEIINVGYRSVNCYLLITEGSTLLIDVGWPNGMAELKVSIASHGRSVKDVRYALMTHYHIDHAGIAQEVKDKGARLIVMENQVGHLNDLKRYLRPPMNFHEVRDEGNIILRFVESRPFLKGIGIEGTIIQTQGHGPDHVTLVLDEGIAFTGDLPPENGSAPGTLEYEDWVKLRSMGVKRVFPAHGACDIQI